MKTSLDKITVLDCIGFDVEGRGELATRFAKCSVHPDGHVTRDGNQHRFVLMPGDDIDDMIERITPHLNSMGYDGPSERDIARLKAHAMVEWTPEILATVSQRWAQWEAQNIEHCNQQGIKALTMEQGRMVDFIQRLDTSIEEWLWVEQGIYVEAPRYQPPAAMHKRMLQ